MKRFIVATAIAVAFGFGFAGEAGAQIVYGYSVPSGSGQMTGSPFVAPGGFNNNFFARPSPGLFGRPLPGEQNVFVPGFNRPFQFDRSGFRNDFYRPNTFQPTFYGMPYGGFNNFYMRGGRR